MKKITTWYWAEKTNIGDFYGYWLLNKILSDRYILEYTKTNPDIIGVGSTLDRDIITKSTLVFGSGRHNMQPQAKFTGNLDNVIAIRGKLSQTWLTNYGYLNNSYQILGDPGLYISQIYDKPVKKEHAFGLVCHWKDYNFFKNKYGDRIHVISTQTNNVEAFIDDLRSCKFIFSSSLHGLIFAHSYGIPAVHLKYLCTESKDDFKFKDYYSVLDIDYKQIIYDNKFNFEKYLSNITNITDYMPTKRCIQLINTNLSLAISILKQKLQKITADRQDVMTACKNEFNPKNNIIGIDNELALPNYTEDLQKSAKTKICLCGIAKLENKYIREWTEHYLNLGFDKIYLYDNNDIDGEDFTEVIADYIDCHKVEIINVRGKQNQQIACYNNFYHTYAKKYDWVAFFDIDEFLVLKTDTDIHQYVARAKFKNFDGIAINWKYFDDNDLTSYSSEPVTERFTREYKERNWAYSQYKFSKRIVKTNLNLVINSSHGPIRNAQILEYATDKVNDIIICNTNGELINNHIFFEKWTHDTAYLAHYRFKTIEEYITNKMARGYATLYKNSGKDLNLDDYFELNKVTLPKLQTASKLLNIPISKLLDKYDKEGKLHKINKNSDNYLYF